MSWVEQGLVRQVGERMLGEQPAVCPCRYDLRADQAVGASGNSAYLSLRHRDDPLCVGQKSDIVQPL